MTTEAQPAAEPPWLTVARAELGVREAPGKADNPRIVEYLRATRLPERAMHDETAHCAAFVCWCLEQAGMPNPGTAMARHFLDYGKRLLTPRVGCIAVLSRGGDMTQGHTGFYVGPGHAPGTMLLLGANQMNSVRISSYPDSRLLGLRWVP